MKTSTYYEVQELNEQLSESSAQDIVAWAIRKFGDKVTLASSFGVEDVVLVDILSKITDSPRVFMLDTGRLHQETYDLVDRIRSKYGINVETYFPQTEELQNLVWTKGTNSFYGSVKNRKECCQIRKVEPLARALSGVDAWITGLRRSQAVTRGNLPVVEIDNSHSDILKINPLANWDEEQVWEHIRMNNVPYNKLHNAGFPSIGCAPCTRAVEPGEDIRAGRWCWEYSEHKECGLHSANATAYAQNRNNEVMRI